MNYIMYVTFSFSVSIIVHIDWSHIVIILLLLGHRSSKKFV